MRRSGKLRWAPPPFVPPPVTTSTVVCAVLRVDAESALCGVVTWDGQRRGMFMASGVEAEMAQRLVDRLVGGLSAALTVSSQGERHTVTRAGLAHGVTTPRLDGDEVIPGDVCACGAPAEAHVISYDRGERTYLPRGCTAYRRSPASAWCDADVALTRGEAAAWLRATGEGLDDLDKLAGGRLCDVRRLARYYAGAAAAWRARKDGYQERRNMLRAAVLRAVRS